MHKLTFFPLGNADCCRIDLEAGEKILFDYADMRCAEDDSDLRIDLPAELRQDLKAANRDFYLTPAPRNTKPWAPVRRRDRATPHNLRWQDAVHHLTPLRCDHFPCVVLPLFAGPDARTFAGTARSFGQSRHRRRCKAPNADTIAFAPTKSHAATTSNSSCKPATKSK